MSKERLYSIFDIAGKKEIGMAQAFGVILRKDKTLLNNLIRMVLSKDIKLNNKLFEKTNINFEKSSTEGRTDIEIENETIHIIIEAKTKTSEVGYGQAEKYSKKLMKSNAKYKSFIYLTEIGNTEINSKLKNEYPKINYCNITWSDTLSILKSRKKIEVNLIEEYETYIMEAQKMKIYDYDIWAVKVIGKEIKNYDKLNFYRNDKRHAPVLIGKREWSQKLKRVIIKELRPVLRVLDKGTNKKYPNDYLYQLGPAFKLEKPILRKFGQAGAISIRFDEVELES